MGKFLTSAETLLGGLLGLISAFIMPIAPFLALAGMLIVLDTITGIRASLKRGEKPTSRKARRMIDKTMVYGSSIVACHGVEVVMKLPDTVTYFAVGAIAFTELLSVLENTRVVTGTNIAEYIRGLLPVPKKNKDEGEDVEQ